MGAPLAVGGVHTPVVLGLLAVALLVLVLQTVMRRHSGRRAFDVSLPSLAFWLLAAASLVQLIPWPPGLQDGVGLTAGQFYQDGWQALFGEGGAGRWRPLSLDPGQTADRALRWLLLAIVGVVAVGDARSSHHWRHTLRLVVAAGIAVLGMGALQYFSGATEVLFVYKPDAELAPLTTFINTNHAAVFYGLVSLSAAAIAVRNHDRDVWISLGTTILAVVFMVAMFEQRSMGASLAYGVAIATGLALVLRRQRRPDWLSTAPVRRVVAGLAVVLFAVPVAGLIVLGIGGGELWQAIMPQALADWITEANGVRLAMTRASLDAAGDFWLLGAGGGSVGRVIPAYLDWAAVPPSTMVSIENQPIEWLTTYGVLVGVAACVLLLGYAYFAMRHGRHSRSYRYDVAATVAVFLGINALFHFPFFAMGIAVPAIFLMDGALGSAGRRASRAAADDWKKRVMLSGIIRPSPTVRRGMLAALAVAVVASTAAWAAWSVDLSEDLPTDPAQPADLARLAALIPADGDLYARAAIRASRQGELDRAVRLADHAFAIEPSAPVAMVLARTYARAGQNDEAVAIFRRVFSDEFARVSRPRIGAYLARVVADLEQPADIAAALSQAEPWEWKTAHALIATRRDAADAIGFALALVEQRPDAYVPYSLVVRDYLQTDQPMLGAMWAQTALSRKLEGPDGTRPAGFGLLVEATSAQDKPVEARRLALQALQEVPGDRRLAFQTIRLRPEVPAQADDALVDALRTIDDHHCKRIDDEDRLERIRCTELEAWLAERRGQPEAAEYALRRLALHYDKPMPLARHYLRHNQCDELANFAQRWKEQTAAAGEAFEALREHLETCAPQAPERQKAVDDAKADEVGLPRGIEESAKNTLDL